MIKVWCLGFIFSSSLRHVVLMKKSRSMHIGLWNGVGGKLEDSKTMTESYLSSMVRECQEETGMITSPDDWVYVGDLANAGNWNVRVFGLRDTEWFNVRPDILPFDSWSLLESIRPDIPMFIPVTHVSAMTSMAPHTGALIHASLAAVRDGVSPITIFV